MPTTERKAQKHCPSCDSWYPPALVVCPRDRTMLIMVQEAEKERSEPRRWLIASKRFDCRYCRRCKKSIRRHPFASCPDCGTEMEEEYTDEGGGRVGPVVDEHFQLESYIGSGTLFDVYSARDRRDRKTMAVKLLKENPANDTKTLSRFLTRAKAAQKLKHDRIITVHSVNCTERGVPYLICDYITGHSLHRELACRRRIDLPTLFPVLFDLLDALQYAHGKDLYHGAIGTSNIYL